MNKEKLFEQWLSLKDDIQHLAGIVQNDIVMEEIDLLFWLNEVDKFKEKFDHLKRNTITIVRLGK